MKCIYRCISASKFACGSRGFDTYTVEEKRRDSLLLPERDGICQITKVMKCIYRCISASKFACGSRGFDTYTVEEKRRDSLLLPERDGICQIINIILINLNLS
jgi:hypothetical protein